MKKLVLVLTGILCLAFKPTVASDFHRLENARLVEHSANDGDSFHFVANGQRYLGRLYFVDCPETSSGSDVDARRVREQTRYFGLPDANRLLHNARSARNFTTQHLAQPFTVHTTFASAMGRSAGGRIYVFVTTSDGKDLAELLVANGYARAQGVGRETPSGQSRQDVSDHLRDLELSAAMRRIGIWSETDPERLVAMREEEREDSRSLQAWRGGATTDQPVDINQADAEELATVRGIGPSLAAQIVQNRPYQKVEDLLRVSGIGPQTLDRISPYIRIASDNTAHP
jgi:competence protein ComEA